MSRGPMRIAAISVDCPDPTAVADFYVTLLGGELLWSTADSVGVATGGWVLALQRVDGYQPPQWPGHSILHLDLNGDAPVEDLVNDAVNAGARVAAHQPDPRWTVLLDPAGHPFCITPFSPVVPANTQSGQANSPSAT